MSAEVSGSGGYADEVREHTFDGIQEFDNRLPNWWLWSFYLACIFSFFYWMHFHVLKTGALPMEEYRIEVQQREAELAASQANVSDEDMLALAQDAAVVERGKAVFTTNCVACHGANGASMVNGVGPNLTDKFWIHGGAPSAIHNTIYNGVLEKGMVAWGPALGSTKVQEVTAYVLTLRNTNVEGKEPQGEPYEGQ